MPFIAQAWPGRGSLDGRHVYSELRLATVNLQEILLDVHLTVSSFFLLGPGP